MDGTGDDARGYRLLRVDVGGGGAAMRQRRGFAMRELVAVLIVGGLVVVFLVPQLTRVRGRGQSSIKDGVAVRSLVQAMNCFAAINGNTYPLPSLLDKGDSTVSDPADEKNTTGNIAAVLIYQGILTPEDCISPLEVNPKIKVCSDFACCTRAPSQARNPERAVWDPLFRCDFTTGDGNISYANLQPAGGRLRLWSATAPSTTIVWASRGPEITAVDRAPDGRAMPRLRTESSLTFLLHNNPTNWEGNIGFADNHVEHVSGLARTPEEIQGKGWGGYDRRDGDATRRAPDVWHYDEPDDVHGSANTFLGIFVKSGKTPADFRAIWD